MLDFDEGDVKTRIKNMLSFKKPSRIIIIVAVVLAALVVIGFMTNRTSTINLPENDNEIALTAADIEQIKTGMTMDEVHDILGKPHGMLSGFFGEFYYLVSSEQATIYYNDNGENITVEIVLLSGNQEEERIFFRTGNDTYNPDFISVSAQLINLDREETLYCGNEFSLHKFVGNDSWQLVPFKNNIGFGDVMVILEYGESNSFNIMPNMLTTALDEGRYRFEINAGHGSQSIGWAPIRAEFSIDKNAKEIDADYYREMLINQSERIPDEYINVIQMIDGRSMTLSDVRTLADRPGGFITMNDLSEYAVDLLGDGLYCYRVVGGVNLYNLIIASADGYIILYTKFYDVFLGGIGGDTSEFIDIRYYNVDKFITDGTMELVRPLPRPDEGEAPNIVGRWKAETGSITHFYEDGTGKTEVNDSVYDFIWKTASFADVAKRAIQYSVFNYLGILSESAASLGIPWGVDVENDIGPDGIIGVGNVLSLVFDDIAADMTFDFAFVLEGDDVLRVNIGSQGQSFSPESDIENRFKWVAFRKES